MDLSLLEVLPDALFVVRDERIAWANAAAKQLLGDELVGSALDHVLAPGERRRLELLASQRARGWSLPATCRVRFVHASDRREITADLRFAHHEDAVVMCARDVTDVRRAEGLMGRLAEMFARGSAFLDADDLLDSTTPLFLELGWVVAFTEIFGMHHSITRRVIAAPDDPVGEYGKSIVGLELPFEKTPILAEVVRTGRPIFLDNLPTLLSGPAQAATALGASMERAHVIRSAWCPVLTNGKISHLLAVTGRDLTEHDFVAVQLFAAQIGAAMHLRALRSELVHKERLAALGEMAAVMAHEVRNPLGIIFNAVASLRRARMSKAALPGLLDIIQEEAERLHRLVADLLDFSRPSIVEPQRVEILPLLRHAVDSARFDPIFQGKAKEVRLEVPKELPPLETDPLLLHRALVNLLINALQNVAPDGKVSMRARIAGDDLCIRVHNEGAPVAPEHAERLFEPFFTTRATGTGLGLAVVRRIADDLGGTVLLEPGDPSGTTFTLTIPLSADVH